MILVRKYPSLSYSSFLLSLGLMTHLIEANYSLYIHTTAVNVRINQKIELQQNVPVSRD